MEIPLSTDSSSIKVVSYDQGRHSENKCHLTRLFCEAIYQIGRHYFFK